MVDDLTAMLAAGDYEQLAVAVFIGLGAALFVALLWLRIFRWIFRLFGLVA